MPFCANCGTKAGDNDRFCMQCGAPCTPPAGAQQAQQPYAYQAQQAGRAANMPRVINALPQAKMMTPMGSTDTYTLVFTDCQVISAKLTGEILKDVAQRAQSQGKSEGKGWMARASSQNRALGSYHMRYLEMTPDQILAETPGNFAVDHASVGSVSVKLVYEATNQDCPGDPYAEIGFDTGRGLLRYRVRMPVKDVAAILNSFYPGRVIK